MATEREETHFVVDSVVLWCLLTLLVISQDEEHGVTLKNVSFVIGQNGGEVSRIVCFLLAERKHRGSQTSLCWSSKTASPDHWFQFLKLQSTFPSLMLWDWSCPPRAGFCPAGRPGGGVIWYDSRFSPTTCACTYSPWAFCLGGWVIRHNPERQRDWQVSQGTSVCGSGQLGERGCKAQSCCRLEASQAQLFSASR